ncbi:MAG: RagB/SusD family nutrient uptake outer membrane protein [Cyclobacteriaceae bacterium]
MKKSFKYIIICLITLGFTGCADYLDEVPVTSVSVDVIFESEEGLEVGLIALYNLQRRNNFPSFGDSGGSSTRQNLFFMVAHDLGHTRTWHRPYGTGHTPTGFGNLKWTRPYAIIDRASAIIHAAQNVEMESADRNRIMAEAKMFRAENYFDLLRMYDRILLDTIPVTPENANDPQDFTPADEADVYATITSDLDFAIQHLDYDVELGKYGQGVARHIRGKIAMWQGDWAEAASQFDNIIDDGTHALVSSVSQVFAQNKDHSESLLVYPRNQELGGGENTAGGGGTWFSSILNNRAYEMSDNQIVQSIDYGGQSLGWSFPNDYLQSLYDQDNDLRYSTYYYPLPKFVNNTDHVNFGQEVVYDDNFRRHHFSLKKYHDEEKNLFGLDQWNDIIYYRFAETLLLGAEAHWRNDSENSANAKALEYVNMVRRRAYNVSDATYDYTEFTLDNYLEESARELAFERNRWFLLKRMGILVERQNLHYTYGSNSGNIVVEPMEPHMVRLPIPQDQLDLMGGTFPQNEGYF